MTTIIYTLHILIFEPNANTLPYEIRKMKFLYGFEVPFWLKVESVQLELLLEHPLKRSSSFFSFLFIYHIILSFIHMPLLWQI